MKDNSFLHILLKFQPKIWKSLVTNTCPKSLYSQKMQSGPLGDKVKEFEVQLPKLSIIIYILFKIRLQIMKF